MIYLPKMVAGPKLGFFRTQNGSFIPPKIIGIHFTCITKIPDDILPKKMVAELPSSEQIFSETSRLVPLFCPRFVLNERVRFLKRYGVCFEPKDHVNNCRKSCSLVLLA